MAAFIALDGEAGFQSDVLRGGWHLVRSGKPARQPQWLLFKDKDAYASDLEADDLLADGLKVCGYVDSRCG